MRAGGTPGRAARVGRQVGPPAWDARQGSETCSHERDGKRHERDVRTT
jgi:hypothetical protein